MKIVTGTLFFTSGLFIGIGLTMWWEYKSKLRAYKTFLRRSGEINKILNEMISIETLRHDKSSRPEPSRMN